MKHTTVFGGCTHVQEVVGGNWRLGRILCDFWTTADVFCCTASILNIAAIALDRYWLITRNVSYTHARRLPRRRACRLMAVFAWCAAAVISVAPLLGWRTGISRMSTRNNNKTLYVPGGRHELRQSIQYLYNVHS